MIRARLLNRWVLFAVVVLALAVGLDNEYYFTLLNFIGIHTLLVVGLNLLLGYAGQISLGHAAFFGLGAYTSGILTATYGVNPWLALLAGLVISGWRRLAHRHPGPEAPGLLPGHGHPGLRHHRLHHLERSPGTHRRTLGPLGHPVPLPGGLSPEHRPAPLSVDLDQPWG